MALFAAAKRGAIGRRHSPKLFHSRSMRIPKVPPMAAARHVAAATTLSKARGPSSQITELRRSASMNADVDREVLYRPGIVTEEGGLSLRPKPVSDP
jgi:hypothetical protein